MSFIRVTAAGAACVLALSACASQGTPPASPSAQSPAGPVGTVAPPESVKGEEHWGLEKATMSVKTVAGLSNYHSLGLTYVSPGRSATDPLDVHHVGWDGKEAFNKKVAFPKGASSKARPVLSYDDALGAAGYWFTESPTSDPLWDLKGPLTWFDLASGNSGTIEPTGAANFRGSARLLGAAVGEGGRYKSFRTVGSDWKQHTHGLPRIDGFGVSSWNGHVLLLGGQSGTATLYLDSAKLLSGLKDPSIFVTEQGAVLFEPSTSKAWHIGKGSEKASPVGWGDCSAPKDLDVNQSNGYLYVGQLLIAPDGAVTCMKDVLGDRTISGVLSDGRVVAEAARGKDGLADYVVVSKDKKKVTPVGKTSPMSFTGGYVLVTTGASGIDEVTVFSEKDIKLGS